MKDAVVLLSGGLDSATVLALAQGDGWRCSGLSLDYGQRSSAELRAARMMGRGLHRHQVLRLDLAALGGSALVDASQPLNQGGPQPGIPDTYVPARNTVLLSLGLAAAEAWGAQALFVGINAVDYSGYPDCRPQYLRAFARLSALATRSGVEGRPISIRAPLLELGKADIVRLGARLGVDYSATVSCYQADADGAACGRCDSCHLRRRGFAAAGLPDPTVYQAAAP